MGFDYSKLRGKIREVCGTQEAFANSIKMGTVSLSKRLNNQLEFTQREITDACRVLNVPPEEVSAYFFTQEVQKGEQ